MDEIEKLAARLQVLEDDKAAALAAEEDAKRKKRSDDFFNLYGNQFSNDRSLGLAILGALQAEDVNTAAASEEVQAILNELRTQCNEILSRITVAEKQITEQIEKIDDIAATVSEDVASNPDASVEEEATDVPDYNVEDQPFEPMPATENLGLPMEEPPVADMSIEDQPFEPMQAPEEFNPPMEEPQGTVSDKRMKQIKAFRATKASKPSNSFKPSSGMLEAAQRGW